MMKSGIVGAMLLLALAAASPSASADHGCRDADAVVVTPQLAAWTFSGECRGVVVQEGFGACVQAIWGVQTAVGGVGGHHGCETYAFVVLP